MGRSDWPGRGNKGKRFFRNWFHGSKLVGQRSWLSEQANEVGASPRHINSGENPEKKVDRRITSHN